MENPGSRFSKTALWIILSWNLFRLVLGPFMGLMPQDAYYFMYAENPDLSYFDHPPAVAYMIWISKSLLGKNVFAIRLADFVVTAVTQYGFFQLARRFLDTRQALLITVVFSTTILVSILSIITTPDVPLMLFWTISLVCCHKAIFRENQLSWLLAGVSMGLAFDSKYTAVFLPLGLFIFLFLAKPYRKYFRTIWPYLTIIAMLITVTPVILWNIENDFASFLFQANRSESISKFSLHPEFLLGVLGHQAFLLLPLIFGILIMEIFKILNRAWKRNWEYFSPNKIFLLAFFLPLWGGFLGISIFYWVKINWQMPAYITGLLLIASAIQLKHVKWHLIASAVIHLILLVQVIFYPVLVKSDDTWIGWKELAAQIDQVRKEKCPDCFLFSSDNYKTSAQLRFHLNENVYAGNIIGQSALQFDFLGEDLNMLEGQSAFFIDSENHFKDLERSEKQPDWSSSYFDYVEELDPIVVYRGQRPVRKYLIYFCLNYKGVP